VGDFSADLAAGGAGVARRALRHASRAKGQLTLLRLVPGQGTVVRCRIFGHRLRFSIEGKTMHWNWTNVASGFGARVAAGLERNVESAPQTA
jgi:hypothetical protein